MAGPTTCVMPRPPPPSLPHPAPTTTQPSPTNICTLSHCSRSVSGIIDWVAGQRTGSGRFRRSSSREGGRDLPFPSGSAASGARAASCASCSSPPPT
eukprot:558189-Rhodomonas_salina.2